MISTRKHESTALMLTLMPARGEGFKMCASGNGEGEAEGYDPARQPGTEKYSSVPGIGKRPALKVAPNIPSPSCGAVPRDAGFLPTVLGGLESPPQRGEGFKTLSPGGRGQGEGAANLTQKRTFQWRVLGAPGRANTRPEIIYESFAEAAVALGECFPGKSARWATGT
jgi:hypothetical protein